VIRLGDAESWFEVRPSRSGTTVLEYRLDYGPESPIGRQTLEFSPTPDAFRTELAPSRTFMLKSEADQILARGLGTRTTYQDLLVFGDDGPIGNPLRFPDECVRHKVLDMIGDLALAGCELVGRFCACRSGHRLNAEMVRTLTAGSGLVEFWRRCA
jgi:UDP-3-O-acyl-N-acetylglucosamine deacetylase